jgi:hypothetical protein
MLKHGPLALNIRFNSPASMKLVNSWVSIHLEDTVRPVSVTWETPKGREGLMLEPRF